MRVFLFSDFLQFLGSNRIYFLAFRGVTLYEGYLSG